MPINTVNTIFTQNIANQIILITENDRVIRLSILCNNGSIAVSGTDSFQNMPSQPLTLYSGQAFTFEGSNGNSVLQGLSIDSTNGQAALVMTRQ